MGYGAVCDKVWGSLAWDAGQFVNTAPALLKWPYPLEVSCPWKKPVLTEKSLLSLVR